MQWYRTSCPLIKFIPYDLIIYPRTINLNCTLMILLEENVVSGIMNSYLSWRLPKSLHQTNCILSNIWLSLNLVGEPRFLKWCFYHMKSFYFWLANFRSWWMSNARVTCKMRLKRCMEIHDWKLSKENCGIVKVSLPHLNVPFCSCVLSIRAFECKREDKVDLVVSFLVEIILENPLLVSIRTS